MQSSQERRWTDLVDEQRPSTILVEAREVQTHGLRELIKGVPLVRGDTRGTGAQAQQEQILGIACVMECCD